MADQANREAHGPSRPTARDVVDTEAYERLLQDLCTTTDVRRLIGLEHALDRIYLGDGFETTAQKARGDRLAKDLARDGRKKYTREATWIAQAGRERLGADGPPWDALPLDVVIGDVETAANVVRRAARRLPLRDRLALTLQARGLFAEAETVRLLGVRPRQARELANRARAALCAAPEVDAAYETLTEALDAGATEAVAALLADAFGDVPGTSA